MPDIEKNVRAGFCEKLPDLESSLTKAPAYLFGHLAPTECMVALIRLQDRNLSKRMKTRLITFI